MHVSMAMWQSIIKLTIKLGYLDTYNIFVCKFYLTK